MPKRFITLFLVILFLAGIARSGTIVKDLSFQHPVLDHGSGGLVITVPGCENIGFPGEPVIPVYTACFLLPYGEDIIGISVLPIEEIIIRNGSMLAPMGYQVPLGTDAFDMAASVKMEVYRSAAPYPDLCGELVSVQKKGAARFAFINIFPCRAVPSGGEITFTPLIRVEIETAAATGEPPRSFMNLPDRLQNDLPVEIENPGEIDTYTRYSPAPQKDSSSEPRTGFSDTQPGIDGSEPGIVPYIIITSESLAPDFESLAWLKILSGLNAGIYTVEWITSNFTGTDVQEQIRNFIIFAWQQWQTRFVLLGGDDEIIPHRSLYVKAGTEIEPDIASDLYYSTLDGNWNTDGDSYYGEPGEEDLLPEVILGRLPVTESGQISNFTAKLEAYTIAPPESRCATALMVGELLWSDPETTWGADSKDETLYGTSNYGFSTAGLPPSFTSATLYDRDLPGTWNQAQLLAILNDGVNLVNHLGHTNVHSVMRLPYWDIPLLQNSGPGTMPFICYSQGCYSASFDNRDDAGNILAEDAIGEQLLTSAAGAVAYIGNTRLGWSSPGTTSSVSQYFDRQFFDALFGEGAQTIGQAFDDSRIDNISYIPYALFRYVMYNMCLLGDPAMPVWTGQPENLEVTRDSLVCPDDDYYTVCVNSGGAPLQGARVSLYGTSPPVYCTGTTNASGMAYLNPSPDTTGSVLLSVWAGNHYLFTDSVSVDFPEDAHLRFVYFSVDDDSSGSSKGDGDGIIESGETISLDLAIKNDGGTVAFDTRVEINCDDPNVSLLDYSYEAGDLPQKTTIIIDDKLTLKISEDIPDGHSLDIGINIFSEGQLWSSRQALSVDAPGLIIDSWSITDTLHGNGNGCLESWEFLGVDCQWTNNGSLEIVNPVLSISVEPDSWARVIRKTAQLPDMAPGVTVASSGELEIFIKEFAPPFITIPVFLTIIGDNIHSMTETLSVVTCGTSMVDDASSEGGWQHMALTGYDGWHISSEDFVSSPTSWKCGDLSGDNYPNMMEAVLITPPLCLHDNSSLSFNHRIDAEATAVYPYWAEDAGVVEISTDRGESWTIINPSGLYPCRASASNTIFLNPYQRCYSGSTGWQSATFDLSAFHGPVLLRFHFASNEQYGYAGWQIDDIVISTQELTGDEDLPLPSEANALHSIYPNPFNPLTMIEYEVAGRSPVDLVIYDVAGRRIRSLEKGIHESGIYTIAWDGRDDRGRAVSSGVYFCRIRIGVYSASRRLVLVR